MKSRTDSFSILSSVDLENFIEIYTKVDQFFNRTDRDPLQETLKSPVIGDSQVFYIPLKEEDLYRLITNDPPAKIVIPPIFTPGYLSWFCAIYGICHYHRR